MHVGNEGIGFVESLDFETGVDTAQLKGTTSDYKLVNALITGLKQEGNSLLQNKYC